MAIAKLPSRNVVLILLLGIGIILFVLLSIFPNYIAYSDITREIEILKSQIEEQKILSPLFNDLSRKAEFNKPANLPFPPKEKLAHNDAGKISAAIQDIIQRNSMKFESVSTDVDSLTNESGFLKLNVQLSGDFMNLRNVMLRLGAMPYLENIESIQISSTGGSSKTQLKLWFAQQ